MDSGIKTRGDSDVMLLPVLSGYRDNQTKKLIFIENYAFALHSKSEQNESPSDFAIAIPKALISSVRLFDLDVFAESFDGDLPPE